MKNRVLLHSLLLINFLSINSCNCQQNNSKNVNDMKLQDSVNKDIPLDKRGNPSSTFTRAIMTDSILGLEPLHNGFRDTLIRFRFGYDITDTAHIIELKNAENQWKAEFYTLIYYQNDKGNFKSIDKKVHSQKPYSGWAKFLKRLYEFEILTLPDQSRIANYPLFTGGEGITVEIATTNSYRIYFYSNLAHAQEITQARQMENILRLIEQEFDFRRLGSGSS